MFLIKAKVFVTFQTGFNIIQCWQTQLSGLIHNVNKDFHIFRFSIDKFDREFHFLLVIEGWKSLVAIQGFFISWTHFKDANWNLVPHTRFYRQVASCFASFKQ